VSLKHATITCEGGKMVIKDNRSKYGTLIQEKGKKVLLGKELKAFQIGNMVFSLQIT
jgi:pSer/pThr/pTyr-binding forkhead associated (FHA) protein